MSARQYITIDDLTRRFGLPEVATYNDPSAQGVIDEDMLTVRIADVGAEIDFYLAQRGIDTDQEIPPLLRKIAADLVRASYFQPHPPASVDQAARRGREMLTTIAQGQWDWRDLPSQIKLKTKKGGSHVR